MEQIIQLELYLKYLAYFKPRYLELLNINKIIKSTNYFNSLFIQNYIDDFSIEGRGIEYLNSIEDSFLARQEGVKNLLCFLNQDNSLNFTKDYIICDVLAGNGYVNKITNHILSRSKSPIFINSDISYFMFKKCLEQGLFAAWQSADNLFWLKSNVVDSVLFAYGTHHIQKEQRPKAVEEAARILKKNGKLVMHDFEIDSKMDLWFRNVVNIFSKTKHNYPHFEKQEMINLAQNAGFSKINIFYIDDPFIIVSNTLDSAILKLGKYVQDMYGLIKLNENFPKLLNLIEEFFGIHDKKVSENLYEVKVIRNAMVCCAVKDKDSGFIQKFRSFEG